ncbi:unnamed protein product [Ascophyllum nodosum]
MLQHGVQDMNVVEVHELAARRRERRGLSKRPWYCMIFGLSLVDGWAITLPFRGREPAACWRPISCSLSLEASSDSDGGIAGDTDLDGDQDGTDLMSQLMGEVNQRQTLLRRESVRLLKRPSALLPPHSVLEHVLGSLRTPDFPTDAVGLQQAFLFSALDQEVSRGYIDYRRDWSDDAEGHPRCLDKKSFDKVIRSSLGFLVGMSDFSISGTPYFSEDDHRVTFPVRVVPDQHTSAVRWVDVDFRLGRVRDGSHKDCWLVERAIVRAWGGSPGTTHV